MVNASACTKTRLTLEHRHLHLGYLSGPTTPSHASSAQTASSNAYAPSSNGPSSHTPSGQATASKTSNYATPALTGSNEAASETPAGRPKNITKGATGRKQKRNADNMQHCSETQLNMRARDHSL